MAVFQIFTNLVDYYLELKHMKELIPLSQKYFEIIALFTREPFVKLYAKELEYYTDGGGLIGFICLDLIDNNFSAGIMSRDNTMQYRAVKVGVDFPTIEDARKWIKNSFNEDGITMHDNQSEYFNLFEELENDEQIHPHYKLLKESDFFLSAKETIKEISYHYKDIDGNFIEQFQSLNGLDSRVFELYLFCFFREQSFSFKREHEAPDFIVNKFEDEIAVEAVTISRKVENIKNITNFQPKSTNEISSELEDNVPLMFGSVLYDKAKKKYWEKKHVQGKPFVIAVADFHDTMSMTWTYNSLLEYLYGYRYDNYKHSEEGELIINPTKIDFFEKKNGTKIPAGFFLDKNNENISAVLFSSTATLSKFNRMGRQAGIGSNSSILVRNMMIYNHEPNADKPNFVRYVVNEDSNETWSEGVTIYHNPNAIHPLDPNLFDETVAQCFFNVEDHLVRSVMPLVFPYASYTENLKMQDTSQKGKPI